jgi:hypothetical protein
MPKPESAVKISSPACMCVYIYIYIYTNSCVYVYVHMVSIYVDEAWAIYYIHFDVGHRNIATLVYVCTYTYISVHGSTYINLHAYSHRCMSIVSNAWPNALPHVLSTQTHKHILHIRRQITACMHACMHACNYVYVYALPVLLCIYIYIYI